MAACFVAGSATGPRVDAAACGGRRAERPDPPCTIRHSACRRKSRCTNVQTRAAAGNRALLRVDQLKPGLTWFCVRTNGTAQRHGWESGVSLSDLPRHVGAREGDVVEACVVEHARPVAQDKFSRAFRNRDRGLLGMEIAFRDKRARLAPTHMLASNLRFDRALEAFLEQQGATADEFAAEGRLRSFSARQYLVPGGGEGGRTRLIRGGTVVAPTPSTGRKPGLRPCRRHRPMDGQQPDGGRRAPLQILAEPGQGIDRRQCHSPGSWRHGLSRSWGSCAAARTRARQPATTCATP